MYSWSGRSMAVSPKIDLIEQNECDIRTQNTKISLNQFRNPLRFFGCYPVLSFLKHYYTNIKFEFKSWRLKESLAASSTFTKSPNPIGKCVFSWWALVLGCHLWIVFFIVLIFGIWLFILTYDTTACPWIILYGWLCTVMLFDLCNWMDE